MNDFNSLKELKKDFIDFESENNLFALEIRGVSVWEHIRYNIYQDIAQNLGVKEEGPSENSDLSFSSISKIFYLASSNLLYKSPFLASESDIVFFGHRRRKKTSSGDFEDIYCDPIIADLDMNYVYLEEPYGLEHEPPRAENVRRLDFPKFFPKMVYKAFGRFFSLKKEEREKIGKIEEKISDRYDLEKDILEEVRKNAFTSKIEKKINKYYLKKIDPELAIFLVSYGRESQIEACKDLGIDTVELQHGVVNETHMGYNYPQGKESFPDYFFTFGEYWNKTADFPINNDRIISVGYPYLEREISKYESVKSKDQVIFISQQTIGERLSKIAKKLSERDRDYEILYKLHPTEQSSWEENYPWLKEADIRVIDSDMEQLYKLFAQSKTQIGVYSTAIYEGLATGLETIIVDLPGSEIMENLTAQRGVKRVSDVDELESSISLEEGEIEKEIYFEDSPKANFRREILDIL